MTVAHGEKFSDSKTSVRKFTSPCGKNPYKISGNIFFAPKNLYLLPDKKAPSLAHSLCPAKPTNALLQTPSMNRRNRIVWLFLILPMFFASYDNSERTVQSARENNIQR
jgi:hypothetical protein